MDDLEEFIIGKSEFSIENSLIYVTLPNSNIHKVVIYSLTNIPIHKNHTLINLHDYDIGNSSDPA